jgi:predicted protein tyrosine phosphatase
MKDSMRLLVFNRADVQKARINGNHAYISMADSDQDPAALPQGEDCVDILRLFFDDVLGEGDQGRPITAFSREHAGMILDFWERNRDRIDTLVIHCNGGQCRSPAVAAALERIETGDDDRWFRSKRPNILVYRTLLEAFHERQDTTA